MSKTCGVDCEQGRLLGCKTYCCRLLVRLSPDEMETPENGQVAKGFVDKDVDGYCIHFDREKFLCGIWMRRPEVCRTYDCNHDRLLQVAIKKTFRNLVDLVNLAGALDLSQEEAVRVPYTDEV